jgi:hydroxymethylpyrimidine/phosphomethylpyrimidine kinase
VSPYRDDASPRRDVLACAGLDPSGGAGLIADTRVISELGARPIGVVTTLTIQNTTGVIGGQPADAEIVSHQLAFVLSDIEVHAVKIGMLGSSEIARSLASSLQLTAAPVVWDPVMQPSRGDLPPAEAWMGDAIAALRPHLTLITPNAQELAFLAELPVGDLAEAEIAGRALAQRLDCAVLIKGGHLGGDEAIDVLLHPGGREQLRGPRARGGEHVHGTGCALSSAIATYLARGRDLVEACRLAKDYVAARIADPVHPGRGEPAVL